MVSTDFIKIFVERYAPTKKLTMSLLYENRIVVSETVNFIRLYFSHDEFPKTFYHDPQP